MKKDYTQLLHEIGRKCGVYKPDIDETIKRVNQMIFSGLITGDDLNALMERMPGIFGPFCHNQGITFGELRNKAHNRKLTVDELLFAIDLWSEQ